MTKIAIGSDHGGFNLKGTIIKHLEAQGHEVQDFGTYSTESCDYPVYAKAVANSVAKGENEKGSLQEYRCGVCPAGQCQKG